MRTLLIIFILVCSLFTKIISQTATTIYTPNRSVVPDTYIIPEATAAQIAALNQYALNTFPNATIVSNASTTYNCHGYAWHITEGGNNTWIGYNTTTAEDIYWTDDSYYEIACQLPDSKVSYASDNHSAITTTTTNIFQSKWGNLPLMLHDKDYTPYNSSTLKYYKKTFTVQAPSLCTSLDYTVNAPTGTTVSWSASPAGIVSLQTNGNTVTLTKVSSGKVDLTVSFTDGCGNSITKTLPNISVGGDMNGYFTVDPSTTQYAIGTYKSVMAQRGASIGFTFTSDLSNITNSTWSWDNYSTAANPTTIYFTAPQTGYTTITKYVHLDGTTACGTSRVTTTLAIMSLGWSYRVAASPNPATNEINITFTKLTDSLTALRELDASENKNSSKTNKTQFTLYDFNTNAFIRQWSFNETELSNHKLSITGVVKGTYVLKIDRDNETSSIKLFVL